MDKTNANVDFAEKTISTAGREREGEWEREREKGKKCVHILLDKIMCPRLHLFYALSFSKRVHFIVQFCCLRTAPLLRRTVFAKKPSTPSKTKQNVQNMWNECELPQNTQKTLFACLAICTSHSYVEQNNNSRRKKKTICQVFYFCFFFARLIHSFPLCFVSLWDFCLTV